MIFLVWSTAALLLLFGGLCRELYCMRRQLRCYNRGGTKRRLTNQLLFPLTTRLAAEINRSITAQEEAQARAARKEEQIRQSLAQVSHDLRTPLTVLQGYLELLEETEDPEEKRAYLRTAKRKAEQAGGVVETFYEVSLLESGGCRLSPEALDLTELVTDCILDHAPLFQKQGLEPQIILPKQPCPVKLDRAACVRIVGNLFQNARRYTAGSVKITLENIGEGFALTVSNQAPGLEQETVEQLFERFYCPDKARRSGSSGLGLYIVKLLSKEMGLEISARLEAGWLTIKLQGPAFV